MAQRKSGSKNEKITLKEFRAWLQGVEELQPKDWCPDREQWKKIRKKIDCIVEEEPQPAQPPAPPVGAAPGGAPQDEQAVPAPAPGGGIPEPTGPPIGGSQMEVAAAGAPAPAPAPQMSAEPAVAPPQGGGGGGTSGPAIRTPDIDTSDGSYGSSFE